MHEDIEGFEVPPPEVVERAASMLRLVGEPTRLTILWALAQGETNVGCLAELAGATPTAVSQHLSRLRLAGVVTTRREGTYVYYSIANPHLTRLLVDAVEHSAHHEPGVDSALAAVSGTLDRDARGR